MLKGIVSGSPVDITRIAMKGKNLFNVSKLSEGTAGKYLSSDGTETNNGAWTITPFIPVDGDYVTLHGPTGNSPSICVYDENLQFVRGEAYQTNVTNTISIQGAAYVRFSLAPSSQAHLDAMLNYGQTPLPYEPYGMQPGWEVRDQQGAILWAADKTLTGTDSIQMKGYGLPLTDYKVEADMTVPATQEYSIEGTSSIDYQSDGTALSDLEFQGNMTQSGTPSSSSPIYPSEMGERTGNLFDNDTKYSEFKTTNCFSGVASQINTVINKCFTADDIGKTFTATCKISNVSVVTNVRVRANVGGTTVTGTFVNDSGTSEVTFTVATVDDYVSLTYSTGGSGTYDFEGIMLVEGSEPATYEPYGYKIPFSNGQTSYNVYLTEPLRKIDNGVSTIVDLAGMSNGYKKRIEKVVFTGTENVAYNTKNDTTKRWLVTIPISVAGTTVEKNVVSSHFRTMTLGTIMANGGIIMRSTGSDVVIGGGYSDIGVTSPADATTIVTAVKAYLAQQYQNGTPVTIWYVLATETTEQVTFPTVTPAQGANTLSVSTTLAPSKTRLTATSGVWPKNPIWPAEFGELVESGEHAGQFKIPITCGGNTYNVFTTAPLRKIGSYADYEQLSVGEGRKIAKLVLDGTEDWQAGTENFYTFVTSEGVPYSSAICTHTKNSSINNNGTALWIKKADFPDATTAADFKAFLAQEYTAGHPVTIWYVLATEQTTPTQLPTITPTDGNDTFAVNTTVPPSAVTIKGHVKQTS